MEVELPERDQSNPAGDAFGRDDAGGAWGDRDLLEGVRRRDSDALARFFDATFPSVYNLAFRLSGNREAAEDITQEVFLKVFRAADRLDVNRNPRPWLTTIIYNACRDAARRRSARPEDAVDAVGIGERHEAGATPEDVLEERERMQLVERALRQLDEEFRTVVILRDYCGFSHDQIADIVGASHDAARKRYSRALSRMGEIIKGLEG
jgi:RNA polymerase sigma-70 factor (ECF subfamily)